MESYHAIHKLMEVHGIGTDSYGNCQFKAVIEYRSPARNGSGETDVTIIRNGYKDGSITLTETDVLSADNFHLDFSTDWQQYRFKKDNSTLVITGRSDKMGGTYSVSILPIACI